MVITRSQAAKSSITAEDSSTMTPPMVTTAATATSSEFTTTAPATINVLVTEPMTVAGAWDSPRKEIYREPPPPPPLPTSPPTLMTYSTLANPIMATTTSISMAFLDLPSTTSPGPVQTKIPVTSVGTDHKDPNHLVGDRSQHGARAGTFGIKNDFPESQQHQTAHKVDLGDFLQELARGIRDVPIHRIAFPTFNGEDYENPKFFLRRMEQALLKRKVPADEWAYHALGQIKGKEEKDFLWYQTQEMTWDQFISVFYNKFMNKARVAKLTSKFYGEKQIDEPATKFLQRKRSMMQWLLPALPEESAVNIVFELLHPRVRYVLRAERITSMEELVSRSQDTENDLQECEFSRPANIRFRETSENFRGRGAGETANPK